MISIKSIAGNCQKSSEITTVNISEKLTERLNVTNNLLSDFLDDVNVRVTV